MVFKELSTFNNEILKPINKTLALAIIYDQETKELVGFRQPNLRPSNLAFLKEFMEKYIKEKLP